MWMPAGLCLRGGSKCDRQWANFGYGKPSFTNNFIAEDHWAFNPNLTRYEYDLQKAKDLFAKAGVGPDTKLTWWTLAGSWPEWVTIGEILSRSLSEIGIKMDIQQNEVGAWVEPFYPSGKQYPNLVIPNGDTAALDPAYPLKFFASGRCECNYNDPKIDAALAAGKSTTDQEKRKVAYQEVQQIVNDQIQ
jgi:peptide/nickel transport system substrate-binding protein